jgi:tetrahydromethanopterin S-methyltransferase subunit D
MFIICIAIGVIVGYFIGKLGVKEAVAAAKAEATKIEAAAKQDIASAEGTIKHDIAKL